MAVASIVAGYTVFSPELCANSCGDRFLTDGEVEFAEQALAFSHLVDICGSDRFFKEANPHHRTVKAGQPI